jgi:hypothetical protein
MKNCSKTELHKDLTKPLVGRDMKTEETYLIS